MIDRVLQLIAPHICCSCGEQNAILCENCYFDIKDEPFSQCLRCLKPLQTSNICTVCSTESGIADAWVVGERRDALKELVDVYKFERVKQAGDMIARLVADRLPAQLPDTVLCYIPDIASHRRQRGYDHMAYIATRVGKLKGLDVIPLLSRQTHVSQRTLSRKERQTSQQGAVTVTRQAPGTVLLIDDIYTTGATLAAGAAALRAAGTDTIYAAIVARQPLDEMRDL